MTMFNRLMARVNPLDPDAGTSLFDRSSECPRVAHKSFIFIVAGDDQVRTWDEGAAQVKRLISRDKAVIKPQIELSVTENSEDSQSVTSTPTRYSHRPIPT